jgi:hypothetical protein
LPVFVAAWIIIGFGMGAGLYDPSFSALGRLYGFMARTTQRQGQCLPRGIRHPDGPTLTADPARHGRGADDRGVLLDWVGPTGTLTVLFGAAILHLALVIPLVPMALRKAIRR